jgi:hypothetical protein
MKNRDCLQTYLKNISRVIQQAGTREETYYSYLKDLVEASSEKKIEATILPPKTEAATRT